MAASFPNGTNTFIPNAEATHNMVADFSRNPNKFPLPKWTQYVQVELNRGLYIEMTVEQAGRIMNANGSDAAWADGTERPSGQGNAESFEFKPYVTKRFNFGVNIGELAAGQATWPILAQNSRIQAQRMMTLRSQRAITVATTSGNYPSGHTSAVGSISGVTNKWDQSTVARMDIKRSLDHGFDKIRLSTLGAVEPGDVQLVLSPGCARKISTVQEVTDMIRHSDAAKAYIEKGIGNAAYGLPETLYGYQLVVENTVKVTSRKGATKVTADILADSTPFMCSRPGALEGVEGAPSFSTFTVFLKEEMTVEEKHDRDNRRHMGSITDDHDVVMTSPISGFLFTAAVD